MLPVGSTDPTSSLEDRVPVIGVGVSIQQPLAVKFSSSAASSIQMVPPPRRRLATTRHDQSTIVIQSGVVHPEGGRSHFEITFPLSLKTPWLWHAATWCRLSRAEANGRHDAGPL